MGIGDPGLRGGLCVGVWMSCSVLYKLGMWDVSHFFRDVQLDGKFVMKENEQSPKWITCLTIQPVNKGYIR